MTTNVHTNHFYFTILNMPYRYTHNRTVKEHCTNNAPCNIVSPFKHLHGVHLFSVVGILWHGETQPHTDEGVLCYVQVFAVLVVQVADNVLALDVCSRAFHYILHSVGISFDMRAVDHSPPDILNSATLCCLRNNTQINHHPSLIVIFIIINNHPPPSSITDQSMTN